MLSPAALLNIFVSEMLTDEDVVSLSSQLPNPEIKHIVIIIVIYFRIITI